jgi:hypothetical protein
MELTWREFWLMLHLGLGIVFIHAFGISVKELVNAGTSRWLELGTVSIAFVCWLTVISGTYWVYNWYRAAPLTGADLSLYPRSYLLAEAGLSHWHKFGMEWKEHIGWLTPILATAVAYVAIKYREVLNQNSGMRKVMLGFLMVAFISAIVAAVLGAFINKVSPNAFLDL